MAERTYIALIETDTDGLSVSFPDLPGCVSGGDTLDHAVLMAKEALSLHLDGIVEDGQPLPDARSLAEIAHQDDLPSRFVYAAITVPEPEVSERVNVYMPKSLLAQIERFGERSGIDNRSTFFRLAARYYLTQEADKNRKRFLAISEGRLPNEEQMRAAQGLQD
jgi:predicted RNase H-like HicB family nuclease